MRLHAGFVLLLLVGCDRATPLRAPAQAASAGPVAPNASARALPTTTPSASALPTTTPSAAASEARSIVHSSTTCGDVEGAWSPVVSGLRGRLVTSGSKPDHSALRIVLELENVSDQGPLEIHWMGDVHLGFATFRLDDAAGNDIEPPWRLGGNAPSGNIRAFLPPAKVVRYDVHGGPFETMMGGRILRIGAFWGRQLPSDGSRRFLRGQVTGAPALDGAIAYEGNAPAAMPRGRVWIGRLELPAVCIR